jgi:hypothetical protein
VSGPDYLGRPDIRLLEATGLLNMMVFQKDRVLRYAVLPTGRSKTVAAVTTAPALASPQKELPFYSFPDRGYILRGAYLWRAINLVLGAPPAHLLGEWAGCPARSWSVGQRDKHTGV